MTTESRPPPLQVVVEEEREEGGRETAASAALSADVSSEDVLLQTLRDIWHELCITYDVIAQIPEMSILFEGARLNRPYDAAEQILANMLTEIVGRIDRFSPWYTKPSTAFGLMTKTSPSDGCVEWCLTAAAYQKWWETIDTMAALIEENANLIRAMVLVDGLLTAVSAEDTRILAQCHCFPPRHIRVRQSILAKTEIICDLCERPFFEVKG